MRDKYSSHVYGSLVLSATTPVKEFPIFLDQDTKRGAHTESKYRGLYSTLIQGRFASSSVDGTVAIPSRNKYMEVSVTADDLAVADTVSKRMRANLVDLDSRFEGARQLYKLHKLQEESSGFNAGLEFVAVINNVSEHASLSLISQQVPLHIIGVYDTVNSSMRIVWTTQDDFVENVKATDYTRYVFYRFPTLFDRPLFIYTQSVCAKWYSWSKAFTGADGLLKAFNALENFLFKDPKIQQINDWTTKR